MSSDASPFQLPERLKALPPYLFVEIDRKKRAALAAGKDIINLGVGDPDQPTHEFIVERMAEAIRRPANHRYPHDLGYPAFRERVAAFFERRYGVKLDPQREVLTLIGSKEGLGHLPLATVNPGETVLIPEPGYPVYRSSTLFAGGKPYVMPLSANRGWLPDLDAIPADVCRAARLMLLNYPNNPTGAVANREFFERVVAFARRHGVLVAHDAAYNEVYFEPPAPPSILEVPGARDVAVELHSLSKTFNMTGWRLGFAVGNAAVLDALARIKANVDSGQFSAIQEAGAAAYDGIGRPEVAAALAAYRARRDALCDGLRRIGWRVETPRATFYVWAPAPEGYDAMGAVSRILEEAAVVCVPGTGFGPRGEGYLRFALTVDVARVHEAVERIGRIGW